jgi:hypothetical protein
MRFVKTTKSKAAAAVSINARLGQRERGELLGLMRPWFARVEPWLQARKYVGAVMSGLPKRNGWTVAQHVGDRTPDRTQRLLNRSAWDTFAVMSVVRRFAVIWIAVFAVMDVLPGAGVSDSVAYGLYPVTVPLIAAGLAWAGITAARADWPRCGTGLAVAVTGAVALSAGPAGAWAVAGVGLCVTLLGHAAVITCRQRRSVVRP